MIEGIKCKKGVLWVIQSERNEVKASKIVGPGFYVRFSASTFSLKTESQVDVR